MGAVAIVGAGVAVVGGTASTASAAAGWFDGQIRESTIVNCFSIIQGAPYVENGAGAFIGSLIDAQNATPAANQTFYIHIYVSGLGNSCAGQYFVPDLWLPSGVSVDTGSPIYCITKFGVAHSPSSDCPAWNPSATSPYGGQTLYLSNDTAHARTWPLPQGAWWEFRIPVKSNRVINGENFYSFVKMIDGNDSPILPLTAPMYVFNAASPPPQPAVTIDYDTPSTVKSGTMPDGTTPTKYGLYSKATINVWQRGGYWSMDLGPTKSYGQSLTPQFNAAGFDTWNVSFDWDNAPTDVLTVNPGSTYHWRAKWGPSATGPWTYGTDQTFTRPPLGATCDGKPVTVFLGLGQQPTAGNDVILGTPASETINGGAGDDTICGGGGNDIFQGGPGADKIVGNPGGSDTIDFSDNPNGAAGVAVNLGMSNGGGDTYSDIENVIGTSYNDTLTGTAGKNTMIGGPGNDHIDGGGGNDALSGGAGNDTLIGGAGIDAVGYIGGPAVTVNLSNPLAQNTIGAGTDTISGVENLFGSSGNDNLTGTAGPNYIDAGAGNDTVRGLGGDDFLIGGAGTNTVSYAGNAASVTVNLSNTAAQNTGGAGVDKLSGFANLIGGNGNDNLLGTTGANRIDGGPGNDTIRGLAGNDVLIGGAGVNTVSYAGNATAVKVNLGTAAAQNTGGAGIDTLSGFANLIGGNGADNLLGTTGANRIDGGPGNDTIRGLAGNDVLIGGAGVNTVSYAGNATAVKVSLAITVAQNTLGAGIDTLSGFANLTGGNGADTLTGNAGANTLNGGAGIDHCNGGAGVDVGISCEVKTGIP
jgi:Ca2+-binding RTX toxin-like protein